MGGRVGEEWLHAPFGRRGPKSTCSTSWLTQSLVAKAHADNGIRIQQGRRRVPLAAVTLLELQPARISVEPHRIWPPRRMRALHGKKGEAKRNENLGSMLTDLAAGNKASSP